MRSKRVMWPRRHDAGIAEQSSVGIFQRPAAEAVIFERRHIAIELGVACGTIQGAAKSGRDRGRAVGGGKGGRVGFPPVPERQPIRTDLHRCSLVSGMSCTETAWFGSRN